MESVGKEIIFGVT